MNTKTKHEMLEQVLDTDSIGAPPAKIFPTYKPHDHGIDRKAMDNRLWEDYKFTRVAMKILYSQVTIDPFAGMPEAIKKMRENEIQILEAGEESVKATQINEIPDVLAVPEAEVQEVPEVELPSLPETEVITTPETEIPALPETQELTLDWV